MAVENIILKLVEKGMGRQDAHEIVRKYAIEAQTNNKDFKEIFLKDKNIKKIMNKDELE